MLRTVIVFSSLDSLGDPVSLPLPTGEDTHRTSCGVCLSLLALLNTLVYLAILPQVLFTYKNTMMTFSTIKDYYSLKEKIKPEDGFRFAIEFLSNEFMFGSAEESSSLRPEVRITTWSLKDYSMLETSKQGHKCTRRRI